jgi:hypothetical protein
MSGFPRRSKLKETPVAASRQTELSKKYADEHGLVLDTSLNLFDEDLSGYGRDRRAEAIGLSTSVQSKRTAQTLIPVRSGYKHIHR